MKGGGGGVAGVGVAGGGVAGGGFGGGIINTSFEPDFRCGCSPE